MWLLQKSSIKETIFCKRNLYTEVVSGVWLMRCVSHVTESCFGSCTRQLYFHRALLYMALSHGSPIFIGLLCIAITHTRRSSTRLTQDSFTQAHTTLSHMHPRLFHTCTHDCFTQAHTTVSHSFTQSHTTLSHKHTRLVDTRKTLFRIAITHIRRCCVLALQGRPTHIRLLCEDVCRFLCAESLLCLL